MPTWDALHKDFAIDDGRTTGAAVQDHDADHGGGSVPWVDAPADSHLVAFRFHDAREIAFLKRFRGASLLTVRFKPPEKDPAKGISEYEYEFRDHSEGAGYFEKMKGHSDPGEIVWEMRRAGVPYRKLRG